MIRDVYSTGQIASICEVSRVTVCKWIRENRLKARNVPGSQHLRIDRPNFIEFLEEYGMIHLLEIHEGFGYAKLP